MAPGQILNCLEIWLVSKWIQLQAPDHSSDEMDGLVTQPIIQSPVPYKNGW